jgi:hypothetical protein
LRWYLTVIIFRDKILHSILLTDEPITENIVKFYLQIDIIEPESLLQTMLYQISKLCKNVNRRKLLQLSRKDVKT